MNTPKIFLSMLFVTMFLIMMLLVMGITPARADHGGVTHPLLGGIVGGVLGSTIGSGSGQGIATGIGVALGAMYGHEAAQREHRMRRDVRVPHALHAPTPRIRRKSMTLNCRIAEHRGTTPMYVCQEDYVE